MGVICCWDFLFFPTHTLTTSCGKYFLEISDNENIDFILEQLAFEEF